MTKFELKEDDKKEEEPFGLGCALELFSEVNEVMEMIDKLPVVVGSDLNLLEKAYERFFYVLSQYQEQPHLLDSHLDELLLRLITLIRSPESSLELKHETFKYMYVIIKVRGYKIVVRHLPHEVRYFRNKLM